MDLFFFFFISLEPFAIRTFCLSYQAKPNYDWFWKRFFFLLFCILLLGKDFFSMPCAFEMKILTRCFCEILEIGNAIPKRNMTRSLSGLTGLGGNGQRRYTHPTAK